MFLTRFRKKAAEEKDISRVTKWKEMYEGRSETGVTSLNLAAAICSELARLVTIEMKPKVTGGEVAERALKRFMPKIREKC